MRTETAHITIMSHNSSNDTEDRSNVISLYAKDEGELEYIILPTLLALEEVDGEKHPSNFVAQQLIDDHRQIFPVGKHAHILKRNKYSERFHPDHTICFTDVSYKYTINIREDQPDDSRISVSFKARDQIESPLSSDTTGFQVYNLNFDYDFEQWAYISEIEEACYNVSEDHFYVDYEPSSKIFRGSIYRTTLPDDMLKVIYSRCGICPCDLCISRAMCLEFNKEENSFWFENYNCQDKLEWSSDALNAIYDFAEIDEMLKKYYTCQIVVI